MSHLSYLQENSAKEYYVLAGINNTLIYFSSEMPSWGKIKNSKQNKNHKAHSIVFPSFSALLDFLFVFHWCTSLLYQHSSNITFLFSAPIVCGHTYVSFVIDCMLFTLIPSIRDIETADNKLFMENNYMWNRRETTGDTFSEQSWTVAWFINVI